jgi:hypothetical protein
VTRRVRARALAAGVCALSTVAAGAAAPRPHASFSLQPFPLRTPAYFIWRAKPHQLLTGTLRLVNVGRAAGSVALYPVDATTGSSSGITYLPRSKPRRDVGRWLYLPVRRVSLRPGQVRLIAFSVRVPRTATSGEHVGGIVAEPVESTVVGTHDHRGTGFEIRFRHLTIVAVELRLPGRSRASLRASRIRVEQRGRLQTVLLALQNTGNVIVRPTGTLEIRQLARKVIRRVELTLDSFLPDTAIELPVFLPGRPLPVGTYQADLDLRYATAGRTRWRTTFSIKS